MEFLNNTCDSCGRTSQRALCVEFKLTEAAKPRLCSSCRWILARASQPWRLVALGRLLASYGIEPPMRVMHERSGPVVAALLVPEFLELRTRQAKGARMHPARLYEAYVETAERMWRPMLTQRQFYAGLRAVNAGFHAKHGGCMVSFGLELLPYEPDPLA